MTLTKILHHHLIIPSFLKVDSNMPPIVTVFPQYFPLFISSELYPCTCRFHMTWSSICSVAHLLVVFLLPSSQALFNSMFTHSLDMSKPFYSVFFSRFVISFSSLMLLSYDTIFILCSHTFTILWLTMTYVNVKSLN